MRIGNPDLQPSPTDPLMGREHGGEGDEDDQPAEQGLEVGVVGPKDG